MMLFERLRAAGVIDLFNSHEMAFSKSVSEGSFGRADLVAEAWLAPISYREE